MRSLFVHEGADRPLQVVLREHPLKIALVDLRGADPGVAAEAFRAADRATRVHAGQRTAAARVGAAPRGRSVRDRLEPPPSDAGWLVGQHRVVRVARRLSRGPGGRSSGAPAGRAVRAVRQVAGRARSRWLEDVLGASAGRGFRKDDDPAHEERAGISRRASRRGRVRSRHGGNGGDRRHRGASAVSRSARDACRVGCAAGPPQRRDGGRVRVGRVGPDAGAPRHRAHGRQLHQHDPGASRSSDPR